MHTSLVTEFDRTARARNVEETPGEPVSASRGDGNFDHIQPDEFIGTSIEDGDFNMFMQWADLQYVKLHIVQWNYSC